MSSTAIGNELETKIFDLLKSEIDADRFWAKKKNCKLFRKKGYYSKDRSSEIIFDISIEIFLPGAAVYSMLVLVECKNYTHAVPVDDSEEFFAKVQQVGAANAKAILASSAAFQSGTREFAKSKGMGLLRYFADTNFKWELRRSPSAGARTARAERTDQIEKALVSSVFRSDVFDIYLQSPSRVTNSVWDFFEDLTVGTSLTAIDIRKIANPRSRLANIVSFLEKSDLESAAEDSLNNIGYSSGEVDLQELCNLEFAQCKLEVQRNVPVPIGNAGNPPLGRILFEPPQIQLYAQTEPHRGRERFTLAHELAHHLLNHGKYMLMDTCDEEDFVLRRPQRDDGTDIARLEFQANFFAASLLMPRTNFIADFQGIVRRLEIPNRGFGPLYVDNQPCNVAAYDTVMTRLTDKYGVSRTASKIRLESLGLLRDARTPTTSGLLQSALGAAFKF